MLKFHRKYVVERIFQLVMCKPCDDDEINEWWNTGETQKM